MEMAVTGPMIDDPDGYKFIPASKDETLMMRRRFEDFGSTAVSPENPDVLNHNIENFWDGSYTVRRFKARDGVYVYAYRSPYSGTTDLFELDGYYSAFNGEFHPWCAA